MAKRTCFLIILLLCAAGIALCQSNPKWTSAIIMRPENPAVGTAVTFTAIFVIQSDDVRNLTIAGGVDGVEIHRQSYPELPQRHREEFSFTYTAAAGSHTAYMQIDPDRTIHDAVRSDNRVEFSFRVGIESPARSSSELGNLTTTQSSGGLNLNPQNINDRQILTADDCRRFEDETPDVSADFLSMHRVSLRVGDPIEYRYEFRIKNLSKKCIYRLKYKLMDQGGATVREVTLIPIKHPWVLKGLETATYSNVIGVRDITNFNRCRVGLDTYLCSTITAVLDPGNEIAESNESNNSKQVGPIYWGRIVE